MRPFTFLTPTDVVEATRLLEQHGPEAAAIAGGQSLLLAMKERQLRPAYLVSLSGIGRLSGVSEGADGELVVGATTTYAALAGTELAGWHAEIAAMAGNLADRPVRTMATIGGALCQAEPRFDMLTLVVGTDARLDVVGPSGVRTISPTEFFDPAGGTRLAYGEILASIRFPRRDVYSRMVFRKFRPRNIDQAVASVLVTVRRDAGGELAGVGLTVGATTPVPVVVQDSISGLVGAAAKRADLDRIAADVAHEVLGAAGGAPLVRYQRELVKTLTREALPDALAIARS